MGALFAAAVSRARGMLLEIGERNRYQILSRQQSYHGSTLGALAVSGNRKRRARNTAREQVDMTLHEIARFSH